MIAEKMGELMRKHRKDRLADIEKLTGIKAKRKVMAEMVAPDYPDNVLLTKAKIEWDKIRESTVRRLCLRGVLTCTEIGRTTGGSPTSDPGAVVYVVVFAWQRRIFTDVGRWLDGYVPTD